MEGWGLTGGGRIRKEGEVRRKELVGAGPVDWSNNTGLTVQAKEERRIDIRDRFVSCWPFGFHPERRQVKEAGENGGGGNARLPVDGPSPP